MFWFRLFGIGLSFTDTTLHTPLFSERIGKIKSFRVGKWSIKFLKRVYPIDWTRLNDPDMFSNEEHCSHKWSVPQMYNPKNYYNPTSCVKCGKMVRDMPKPN